MTESWLKPWFLIADDQLRSLLEAELRKEVGPNHPLWGEVNRIVAKRDDQDDILVVFEDGENGKVAEVHLTWSGKAEASEKVPRTVFYESLGDWRIRSMNPANAEFLAS